MLNTLDLNGTWQLRWSDGQRGRPEYAERETTDAAAYINAQVPGEVHLDVWKAGWIPNPYEGTNCLAARWVEECIWSYRRQFIVPPEALAGRAWLCFEGLDLVARIVLNGREVGIHKNAFYPCRIEVTGKLQAGNNLLAVHLESGLYEVMDKRGEGLVAQTIDQRLHKRHWLRKPQCQFAWDWATRLVNVGIFKPVRLEWTAASVRLDQFVPLVELASDLRSGQVRARLFVEGLTDHLYPAQMTVEIMETGAREQIAIEIKPGLHPYEVKLTVTDPELWWPVGHGPQRLYTLRVSLSNGAMPLDDKTARIGFRHVRINQETHPISGRYFVIEVNGRKIFAKGANFVPADMIFARLDQARYEQLINLALEANFNCLRVWGGGLYENDEFYALCDEKGLLVWQEFIFACGKYPLFDEAFYTDVKAETIFNIRRLAEHPSLIIWCGNNEMEEATWHWGFDQGVVMPDYGFFHLTLPRLMAEEDPTRYYQPSSPFSPDQLDPRRDDVGDQHPWSVGFANTDFRDYRKMICRFPNEGGILGPTSLPTMQTCLPAEQRQIASFAWQVHDNAIASWSEPSYPDQMIDQWLGLNIRDLSIDEFTYWGGLLQGEGLHEYCDNFRRRMFDSAAAIFWMYNDCWPATRSWTIVDYYLRRTPAFASVRRAFAPIHVVVACVDEAVVIFGINDTPEIIEGDLRYGLFNLTGGRPFDQQITVVLPPNASIPLASFPRTQWTNPAASGAFAMLSRQQTLIARNRLFLPYFKDLQWAPANVRVHCEAGQAVFESDTFAWGICLDLEGQTSLPDNFFDVYPGIPYALPWPSLTPPQIVRIGNLKSS